MYHLWEVFALLWLGEPSGMARGKTFLRRCHLNEELIDVYKVEETANVKPQYQITQVVKLEPEHEFKSVGHKACRAVSSGLPSDCCDLWRSCRFLLPGSLVQSMVNSVLQSGPWKSAMGQSGLGHPPKGSVCLITSWMPVLLPSEPSWNDWSQYPSPTYMLCNF